MHLNACRITAAPSFCVPDHIPISKFDSVATPAYIHPVNLKFCIQANTHKSAWKVVLIKLGVLTPTDRPIFEDDQHRCRPGAYRCAKSNLIIGANFIALWRGHPRCGRFRSRAAARRRPGEAHNAIQCHNEGCPDTLSSNFLFTKRCVQIII